MKSLCLTVIIICLSSTLAAQCDFRYDPASSPRYYRQEGWVLPGIHDDDPNAKAIEYGIPPLSAVLTVVPGAKAILIRRGEDHYVIRFPEQVFFLGNTHERMHSILAKAIIVRWEINGNVVAYSYSLIPVAKAYKRHDDWVYEGEAGCIFYGTFIDDKGDGVFRTLIPDTLRPEYIPSWAKAPKT